MGTEKDATVARCAIIRKNRKNSAPEVLILKRPSSTQFNPSRWELPGGTEKPCDSSSKATAIRETLEEAGLTISNLLSPPTPAVLSRRSRKAMFVTDTYSGELRLSAEHVDHAWIMFEETGNFDISRPSLRWILQLEKIFRSAPKT